MIISGEVTVKPTENTNPSSVIANGWANASGSSANDKIGGTQYAHDENSNAKLTIKNGAFTGQSGQKSCSVIKNDDYGDLYIYDGKFDSTTNTGTSNATTLLNWNVAHIYGGTFTGQYPISNGAYNNSGDQGLITIEGGTFTGTSSLNGMGNGGDGKGKVTITGGFFSGDIVSFDKSGGYTFEISGGAFTADPSAYLAKDGDTATAYMLKLSDDTYPFGVSSKDVAVTITGTPENFTKTYDESGVALKATVTPEKIEGYTVPYTEGAETPFDVAQISSDITYVASDDNSTQTATVTDGKVSFTRTPKNFKYEYDTGFRRSGRTASAGSFITAEDEDEENGNMDVTIETGSVTGSAGGIASSSGGGCDAGFGYGALSALILVFATLKKRR
ncbi:MAG: hypothetical protein IJT20_05445 [Synergistaceae bacterium]|nr:hypothetical protein [Synergistaceae bacterium]